MPISTRSLRRIHQLALTFFFFFGANLQARQVDQDCIDWFKSNKLEAGSKKCEIECASSMSDMGTFMCPAQCDILRKSKANSTVAGRLIFYPGLTPAEKQLTEKYPKEALTVFVQKTRAEWSSNLNFPNQDLNDESDAFRHFIWAGFDQKNFALSNLD
jgi:hypothetical protein